MRERSPVITGPPEQRCPSSQLRTGTAFWLSFY
jgi:hypothetical protein